MFKAGDKVKFISTDILLFQQYLGKIYTVKCIDNCGYVWLEEIDKFPFNQTWLIPVKSKSVGFIIE
jgi:hypothetical protein